ncbi:MAG TPA: thiamine diphosphokinase [Anaerolineaceae bacterium]|nr:thiamine diphosphokinase [Anaerolineaceae bacterium]
MKRAWIFVNGSMGRADRLKMQIMKGDFLVAVDAGYRHLKPIGLYPDLVIGDLDSLAEADQQEIDRLKIPVQRYPAAKDETDLELAINAVLERGCEVIRIACALGGRFDQSLGNLALLLRPDLADLDVRLEDGETEAWLIRSEAEVVGRAGDTISLLPVGGPVDGVETGGLLYPLHSETLWPHRTRGISNEMQAGQARIVIRNGTLLCVHIRKSY